MGRGELGSSTTHADNTVAVPFIRGTGSGLQPAQCEESGRLLSATKGTLHSLESTQWKHTSGRLVRHTLIRLSGQAAASASNRAGSRQVAVPSVAAIAASVTVVRLFVLFAQIECEQRPGKKKKVEDEQQIGGKSELTHPLSARIPYCSRS